MWYCKTLYLTVMQISCSNIHSPEFQSGTCRWPQVSNLVCNQGKKIALLKMGVRTLFCKTRGAFFSRQLPFALLAVPFGQQWPIAVGREQYSHVILTKCRHNAQLRFADSEQYWPIAQCTYMLLTIYKAIAKHYSLGLQASSKLAIIFPRKPFCL